jgi:hypothetical protein
MKANTERLELLATKLEAYEFAAPAEFKLIDWFRAPDYPAYTEEVVQVRDRFKYVVVDPTKVQCDAAACACGHAALMPEFNAQGFKLVVPVSGAKTAQPFFDGHVGWPAVQEFFGLKNSWAEYLFNPDQYEEEPGVEVDGEGVPLPTPDVVAARIRTFVHDERISHQMGLPGAQ